jgi:hypothetical protein
VTAGDPVIMLEEPLFATDRALAAGWHEHRPTLICIEVNEGFRLCAAGMAQAHRRRSGKA